MATPPAERMRMWRNRQREADRREIRMTLPDARSRRVRDRVSEAVARLDPVAEDDALRWIEEVSDFDGRQAR